MLNFLRNKKRIEPSDSYRIDYYKSQMIVIYLKKNNTLLYRSYNMYRPILFNNFRILEIYVITNKNTWVSLNDSIQSQR